MGSPKWSETAMLVIDMQVAGEWVFFDFAFVVTYGLSRMHCGYLQKEFVDTAMSRLALPAGKAILPVVAEAVAIARERGIFVVWVRSTLPLAVII